MRSGAGDKIAPIQKRIADGKRLQADKPQSQFRILLDKIELFESAEQSMHCSGRHPQLLRQIG